MRYSTRIINFGSDCVWKGMNVDCTKVPYRRTEIYLEGSINNT